eukprot:284816894_5
MAECASCLARFMASYSRSPQRNLSKNRYNSEKSELSFMSMIRLKSNDSTSVGRLIYFFFRSNWLALVKLVEGLPRSRCAIISGMLKQLHVCLSGDRIIWCFIQHGCGISSRNRFTPQNEESVLSGEFKLLAVLAGIEPATLWLTATRSNQLSYKTFNLISVMLPREEKRRFLNARRMWNRLSTGWNRDPKLRRVVGIAAAQFYNLQRPKYYFPVSGLAFCVGYIFAFAQRRVRRQLLKFSSPRIFRASPREWMYGNRRKNWRSNRIHENSYLRLSRKAMVASNSLLSKTQEWGWRGVAAAAQVCDEAAYLHHHSRVPYLILLLSLIFFCEGFQWTRPKAWPRLWTVLFFFQSPAPGSTHILPSRWRIFHNDLPKVVSRNIQEYIFFRIDICRKCRIKVLAASSIASSTFIPATTKKSVVAESFLQHQAFLRSSQNEEFVINVIAPSPQITQSIAGGHEVSAGCFAKLGAVVICGEKAVHFNICSISEATKSKGKPCKWVSENLAPSSNLFERATCANMSKHCFSHHLKNLGEDGSAENQILPCWRFWSVTKSEPTIEWMKKKSDELTPHFECWTRLRHNGVRQRRRQPQRYVPISFRLSAGAANDGISTKTDKSRPCTVISPCSTPSAEEIRGDYDSFSQYQENVPNMIFRCSGVGGDALRKLVIRRERSSPVRNDAIPKALSISERKDFNSTQIGVKLPSFVSVLCTWHTLSRCFGEASDGFIMYLASRMSFSLVATEIPASMRWRWPVHCTPVQRLSNAQLLRCRAERGEGRYKLDVTISAFFFYRVFFLPPLHRYAAPPGAFLCCLSVDRSHFFVWLGNFILRRFRRLFQQTLNIACSFLRILNYGDIACYRPVIFCPLNHMDNHGERSQQHSGKLTSNQVVCQSSHNLYIIRFPYFASALRRLDPIESSHSTISRFFPSVQQTFVDQLLMLRNVLFASSAPDPHLIVSLSVCMTAGGIQLLSSRPPQTSNPWYLGHRLSAELVLYNNAAGRAACLSRAAQRGAWLMCSAH